MTMKLLIVHVEDEPWDYDHILRELRDAIRESIPDNLRKV